MKIEWLETPGHFICAEKCYFRMHTHIGKYCISTVGEMYPDSHRSPRPQAEPETIGSGRLYETMVFELDEDGEHNGDDIDFAGYNDREAATAGHMTTIEKYVEAHQ